MLVSIILCYSQLIHMIFNSSEQMLIVMQMVSPDFLYLRSHQRDKVVWRLQLAQIEKLPATSVQIQQAIQKDVVLSKVLECTQHGWPKQVEAALVPYWNRSQQLSVKDGCLLLEQE